jgi:hypothetical protein
VKRMFNAGGAGDGFAVGSRAAGRGAPARTAGAGGEPKPLASRSAPSPSAVAHGRPRTPRGSRAPSSLGLLCLAGNGQVLQVVLPRPRRGARDPARCGGAESARSSRWRGRRAARGRCVETAGGDRAPGALTPRIARARAASRGEGVVRQVPCASGLGRRVSASPRRLRAGAARRTPRGGGEVGGASLGGRGAGAGGGGRDRRRTRFRSVRDARGRPQRRRPVPRARSPRRRRPRRARAGRRPGRGRGRRALRWASSRRRDPAVARCELRRGAQTRRRDGARSIGPGARRQYHSRSTRRAVVSTASRGLPGRSRRRSWRCPRLEHASTR